MASLDGLLSVPPDRSLAFWEALDQLLESPSDHPWAESLVSALDARSISTEDMVLPAITQAGVDLERFWAYLDASPRKTGYRHLAGDSFWAFRSGPLGNSLRTLLTNLRLFQHCRKSGDTLTFRRLLARMASYDIRLRRRFSEEPAAADIALQSTSAFTLLALDGELTIHAGIAESSAVSLSLGIGSEPEIQTELFEVKGNWELAPFSDSNSDAESTRLAFYVRQRHILMIQDVVRPEYERWALVSEVEIDAQGQVLCGTESRLHYHYQPRQFAYMEPIGVLNAEELSCWQQYERFAEVFTRQSSTVADAVESKDTVIWMLLDVFEEHGSPVVSSYVRQVCSGYLAGLLGYLSSESEHDASPRPNSYRDYLAKEVENSVRRRNRLAPTQAGVVG